MAHNIIDGMISFAGETPWHGLGTRVDPNSTPEAMLQAAKMDWQVEMRSLAVSMEEFDAPTNANKMVWRNKPVAGYRAVVRSDTREVFALPTDRYKPVQNLEIARFFHDYADAASCELQIVGALEGGRKVWALAKINADYIVTAKRHGVDMFSAGEEKATDTQLGYVLIATSHDGSLRTMVCGTSIYVVCWNTMSAALASIKLGKRNQSKDACFTIKHSGKFDACAKQTAASTVGVVKEQLAGTHAMAEQFSNIQLDSKGRIEYVRRLIGGESLLEQIANDKQALESGNLLDLIVADNEKTMPEDTRLGKLLIDSIINSPGNHLDTRKDTLWGAVNGVTHYADHQRGRTADSTLSQAWFGQGATLKAKAVEVAYDMAGVNRQ